MASCFLFYLAHCSKYCWLNFVFVQGSEFGLAAMAEVVVEGPETIFIGTANQVPKELSMCGATSWLLLVLSACTCAWSRLALHMLGIWCLSWKKSWRETSGMWHMKGGLFQMRRASKSWRSALQSFVLRPRFGRLERTSGKQMMCRAEPPTQKRWKNHSGKHLTSWFAHAMRCSCGTTARIASLGLNCFFGGAVWCMWCVCCCRRFASLDSTASWRGCPMQSNATVELPFDRHKAVMDITFAAWCEVNIEFVEWLLCEAVDAMFCLRYVRKNVRRYVRKNVKRYVRKNVRRYVRQNVRRFAVSRCVFMTEAGSGRAKVVVWGKMWQHWCMFDVSDTGSVCLQAQAVFSVCSWYDCSLSNIYIYIQIFLDS